MGLLWDCYGTKQKIDSLTESVLRPSCCQDFVTGDETGRATVPGACVARLKGCQTGAYSIFSSISEAGQNSSIFSCSRSTEHLVLLLPPGQRPFVISCFRCRVESYREISARGSENLPCQTMTGGIAVIGSVNFPFEKPAQLALQLHSPPESFLVSPSLLQTGLFPFFVSSIMRPAKPEPLSD